jgi:cystathionine beta-lyase/cystathionine gamma-synthase
MVVLSARLRDQVRVHAVLFPALPSDEDHALWQRDFTGASGVFSVVLAGVRHDMLREFVRSLSILAWAQVSAVTEASLRRHKLPAVTRTAGRQVQCLFASTSVSSIHTICVMTSHPRSFV